MWVTFHGNSWWMLNPEWPDSHLSVNFIKTDMLHDSHHEEHLVVVAWMRSDSETQGFDNGKVWRERVICMHRAFGLHSAMHHHEWPPDCMATESWKMQSALTEIILNLMALAERCTISSSRILIHDYALCHSEHQAALPMGSSSWIVKQVM